MKRWKKRILVFVLPLIILITILGIVFKQIVFMLAFHFGYSQVYNGNNELGNQIMNFAISKMKNPNAKIYHALSVQNTKNGNYDIAISALEKAYEMDPDEAGAYYGWVLLYYYHDYEKSLEVLNRYDDSTPSFSDWPMGECIHYLKGLAHMQLLEYEIAIQEFNISIENTSKDSGESWIDHQVFVNKGLCLIKLEEYENAIVVFNKAIENYEKCSEAYYYRGLSYSSLNNNKLACESLNTSYLLISQGYKSSDTYVELFNELYVQQVEQSVLENCTD